MELSVGFGRSKGDKSGKSLSCSAPTGNAVKDLGQQKASSRAVFTLKALYSKAWGQ